jgi:hypothetical protein
MVDFFFMAIATTLAGIHQERIVHSGRLASARPAPIIPAYLFGFSKELSE